jgi:atypical protein kinase C zeta type
MLLDEHKRLKLTDFDCVEPTGERSYGNAPPWARLYPEPPTGMAGFGTCGPKPEQFSLGSVVYCLTRGHEPYEHPDDSPDLDIVGLFRKGIFPPLQPQDDAMDCIIDRCWRLSTTRSRIWQKKLPVSREPQT